MSAYNLPRIGLKIWITMYNISFSCGREYKAVVTLKMRGTPKIVTRGETLKLGISSNVYRTMKSK